jgi:hypothetical protein
LAGRRAGALFFARHRDYFVVTRNYTAVYRDLLPFRSFTVTRNFLPSPGTGKKQVTATQTAPNQTAGPLAARQIAAKFALYLDFRRTSKPFAALPCNRPYAAKHMLFCQFKSCSVALL